MAHTFSSDWRAWCAVLTRKKKSIALLFVMMTLLVVIFVQVFWAYQSYLQQIAQLTAQIEIIVEVDKGMDDLQKNEIEQSLIALDQVSSVEYWSQERTLEYLDREIVPGYLDLYKENRLAAPINALFRLQLYDLQDRPVVEEILSQKYSGQLYAVPSPLVFEQGSIAFHFLSSLRSWEQLFLGFLVIQLAFFLLFSAYITSHLVRERISEFHLTEFLGFEPPFPFFSGVVFVSSLSLLSVLFGVVVGYIFIGEVLWMLAFLLFVLMAMVDIAVVVMHRLVKR
ncbi:MAG: permease-like cell division protein FtsX [Candidatus Gracilibacteria bacterium]|nr:permease-like cell division protein FtsX [Candidatus Gracilibacteria bacterium]